MDITREQLMDLLTTAATIGRNELAEAGTRDVITNALEARMASQILAVTNGGLDGDHEEDDPGILQEREARKARGEEGWDGE